MKTFLFILLWSKNVVLLSSRPSTRPPTVLWACSSTPTLWTSTTAWCQTSMRRILTRGTCHHLGWREAASPPTTETRWPPTWLPKVTSQIKFTLVFYWPFYTLWLLRYLWFYHLQLFYWQVYTLICRGNLQNSTWEHHRDPAHSDSANRIRGRPHTHLVCGGINVLTK